MDILSEVSGWVGSVSSATEAVQSCFHPVDVNLKDGSGAELATGLSSAIETVVCSQQNPAVRFSSVWRDPEAVQKSKCAGPVVHLVYRPEVTRASKLRGTVERSGFVSSEARRGVPSVRRIAEFTPTDQQDELSGLIQAKGCTQILRSTLGISSI